MRAAGVLFDKDGTLFDFEASYAPSTAGVVRELAGDEALAHDMALAVGFDLKGGTFMEGSAVIAGTAHDLARAWTPLLRLSDDAIHQFPRMIDMLYARHSTNAMTLFPQTAAVLEAIATAGIAIGLATNDSEENGREHLAAAGIDRHFRFFAGHDSGHGAKPGPGMVSAFARECGVDAGRVVMVGDSRHDMDAARAAGAVAIAIATGMTPKAELLQHADRVIHSLDELLDLPQIGIRRN